MEMFLMFLIMMLASVLYFEYNLVFYYGNNIIYYDNTDV